MRWFQFVFISRVTSHPCTLSTVVPKTPSMGPCCFLSLLTDSLCMQVIRQHWLREDNDSEELCSTVNWERDKLDKWL